MANKNSSAREKDIRLFCGAVIRNIRNEQEFSFQTLYEQTCGKKNPNKAYRLRDALINKEYIVKHRNGSYTLKHTNNDSDKIVADVLEYMKEHPIRPKQEEKKSSLLEGVEISENPQRLEDDVLDGFDRTTGEWKNLPESSKEERNTLFELLDEIDVLDIISYLKEQSNKKGLNITINFN